MEENEANKNKIAKEIVKGMINSIILLERNIKNRELEVQVDDQSKENVKKEIMVLIEGFSELDAKTIKKLQLLIDEFFDVSYDECINEFETNRKLAGGIKNNIRRVMSKERQVYGVKVAEFDKQKIKNATLAKLENKQTNINDGWKEHIEIIKKMFDYLFDGIYDEELKAQRKIEVECQKINQQGLYNEGNLNALGEIQQRAEMFNEMIRKYRGPENGIKAIQRQEDNTKNTAKKELEYIPVVNTKRGGQGQVKGSKNAKSGVVKNRNDFIAFLRKQVHSDVSEQGNKTKKHGSQQIGRGKRSNNTYKGLEQGD